MATTLTPDSGLRFPLLPVVAALAVSAALANAQDAQERIRVQLRTFGWNVERQFDLEGAERPVTVLRMQFTGPLTYSGPPLLRFQPLAGSQIDGILAPGGEAAGRDGDAESAREASREPVVVDLRPLGRKPGRLLLLFQPATDGAPRRVAVFNDELAILERPNVHFYNFSSRELAVRIFSQSNLVAPRGQAVWPVENGLRASPILIAVRDPDARVVYSSRFRLREDQRLVLMARDQNGRGVEDSPVRIASFLERLQEETPDAAEAGADLEMGL